MKRLALLLVALSFPALAAAPPPPPPVVTDSPMVAAAKRSKRLGKKPAFVITDETLARYRGGHITTTTNQRTLNVAVPAPTPEMKAAQDKADQARVVAVTRGLQKKPVVKVTTYNDAEQLYGDGEMPDPDEGGVAPATPQTPAASPTRKP